MNIYLNEQSKRAFEQCMVGKCDGDQGGVFVDTDGTCVGWRCVGGVCDFKEGEAVEEVWGFVVRL